MRGGAGDLQVAVVDVLVAFGAQGDEVVADGEATYSTPSDHSFRSADH